MDIFWCENYLEEQRYRDICIEKIKEYFENRCEIKFTREVVGEDTICECQEKDNYFCLRTLKGISDEQEWGKEMTKLVDNYCSVHKDGFVVLHLSLGGRNKENYLKYPLIQALKKLKIKDERVVIYTSENISKVTFYNEVGKMYHLVATRKVERLLEQIDEIIKL